MTTIKEEWINRVPGLLPRKAGPELVRDVRRAFYMGYAAAVAAIVEAAGSEDADVVLALLESSRAELDRFADNVEEDKA